MQTDFINIRLKGSLHSREDLWNSEREEKGDAKVRLVGKIRRLAGGRARGRGGQVLGKSRERRETGEAGCVGIGNGE